MPTGKRMTVQLNKHYDNYNIRNIFKGNFFTNLFFPVFFSFYVVKFGRREGYIIYFQPLKNKKK